MDGELFGGRGECQTTVGIVKTLGSKGWKKIAFQVCLSTQYPTLALFIALALNFGAAFSFRRHDRIFFVEIVEVWSGTNAIDMDRSSMVRPWLTNPSRIGFHRCWRILVQVQLCPTLPVAPLLSKRLQPPPVPFIHSTHLRPCHIL